MTKYTEMWDIIENKYKDKYAVTFESYKKSVNMRELALIGRAGYGLWQGGELLSGALISTGKFAKVVFLMPGERQNSPTRSFIRYADSSISFPASDIYKPDHLILAEADMLNFKSVAFDIDIPQLTGKMDENGLIIVNSSKHPSELQGSLRAKVATIDAAKIAIELLKNPFHINTTMIGAYIKLTNVMTMDSFEQSVRAYKDPRGRMVYAGEKGEINIRAAWAGYESVKV